jgi:hypothetical protein
MCRTTSGRRLWHRSSSPAGTKKDIAAFFFRETETLDAPPGERVLKSVFVSAGYFDERNLWELRT